jgi:hypothetical protein
MLCLHGNTHIAGLTAENTTDSKDTNTQTCTQARQWGESKGAVLLTRNGVTLKQAWQRIYTARSLVFMDICP